MNTNLTCEYCQKEFSTIYTLKLHQKSSKACITIQLNSGENTQQSMFDCEFCNRSFSVKHNLTVHLRTCKVKKEYSNIQLKYREEKEKLEKQIETLLTEVSLLKKEVENQKEQIHNLQQQNICSQELALTTTSEQNFNIYIVEFNKMFNKLVNCIDISIEESVSKILYLQLLSNLTVNTIEENFIYNFINSIKHFVFCTDISRKNLVFKDENGGIKKIIAENFIIYCVKKTVQQLNQLLKCCIAHLFHLHDIGEINDEKHLEKKLEIWDIRNQIFAGNINKIIQKCAIYLTKNCEYLAKVELKVENKK